MTDFLVVNKRSGPSVVPQPKEPEDPPPPPERCPQCQGPTQWVSVGLTWGPTPPNTYDAGCMPPGFNRWCPKCRRGFVARR